MFYTEERAKYALYVLSEPIHYSSYLIFVRKGEEFKFNKIPDLYNKTIGIQRSFSISKEFDNAVTNKKIIIQEAFNNENNIKRLLANRVDAIIGNEIVSYYNASKMGVLDKISVLPIPVKKKRGAYLVLSKSSINFKNKTELLEKINKAMKDIWLDGTYQKILDKYIH
ncbi:MAG: transporter substrate-binding domain-containing protein [Campylobacteraceae bacterium]|nr:transporter substrate-binding domain-containing protein [Campylobacteraceae bacterium]